MISRFFLLIIAAFALMAVFSPVSASQYVWWGNEKGQPITSVYAGDTAYALFDTVDNGSGADYYTLHLWVKNGYTDAWTEASEPFPPFISRADGTVHYFDFGFAGDRPYPDSSYAGQTFDNHPAGAASFFYPFQGAEDLTCPFVDSPPFGGVYERWHGYAAITVPEDTVDSEYKIFFESYRYPDGYPNLGYLCSEPETDAMEFIVVSNATIAIEHRPNSFDFGEFLMDYGGEGLAYLVAAIIIGAFLILPFFLMSTFNIYVEMFMFALALGICFAIGILNLVIVLLLGVGAIAIYLVTKGRV